MDDDNINYCYYGASSSSNLGSLKQCLQDKESCNTFIYRLYLCMYVCNTGACICVCVHVTMYVCMCVCMYVCYVRNDIRTYVRMDVRIYVFLTDRYINVSMYTCRESMSEQNATHSQEGCEETFPLVRDV